LGTRLREILPDIPKPMAPIKTFPFYKSFLISFLIRDLLG